MARPEWLDLCPCVLFGAEAAAMCMAGELGLERIGVFCVHLTTDRSPNVRAEGDGKESARGDLGGNAARSPTRSGDSGRRAPFQKRRASGASGLLLPYCLFGSPSGNFNFGKKTERIRDGGSQTPPRLSWQFVTAGQWTNQKAATFTNSDSLPPPSLF